MVARLGGAAQICFRPNSEQSPDLKMKYGFLPTILYV